MWFNDALRITQVLLYEGTDQKPISEKKEGRLYIIMLAKSCIYVFIENQEHSNEVELLKALKAESSSDNEDPAWRPPFGHEVSLFGR